MQLIGGQMWSVVNYSNTACGTSEHATRLATGQSHQSLLWNTFLFFHFPEV
jgi:hypothetical protein